MSDSTAPVTLAPGIRRLRAPNPGPMTFTGTNTYLLGDPGGAIAVIDPGPEDAAHLAAILAAVAPGRVEAILVTHAHLDHAPLSRALSAETGAPVLAYGDATAGRSAVMTRLARDGMVGGGEGVDAAFRPDRTVADGEVIVAGGHEITALWTPGHFGNHLCFAVGDAMFTGDLAMGWSTSLVSPPDGDMGDYLASCARIGDLGAAVFWPGHGDPVGDPARVIDELLTHRRAREAQIRAALALGPATPSDVTRAIYTDLPEHLIPAAERNVLAHLIDLHGRGEINARPRLTRTALFAPV